jgi:squalene synthase HpnC
VSLWPEPLARAYAECEALTRAHYENFPVASRLLPRRMRPHIAAVYAFARIADDIADEGTASAIERQTQLDEWRDRIHLAAAGVFTTTHADRRSGSGDGLSPDRDALVAIALGHSIRSLDLPVSLFDDLLSAFGQDTTTSRYASWSAVLDYCRRSANPIGRLVLRIAGHRDDRLDRSSDALCTALQLTNFWQDFGRDWRAGRVYVPREVQTACGACERDLGDGRMTIAWADALDACVQVTRAAFEDGRAVCDGVGGRLGAELRFTHAGGTRMLEQVERARLSLLHYRPTLGYADVPRLLWRVLWWKRNRTSR